MIRNIIGAVVCFFVAITRADAQELGIGLSGGLQGMRYTLPNGQSSLQPGGVLAVSYTFPLGGNWGVLTGVTGGIYRTRVTLPDGQFTYDQVDDAGSAFVYNVKYTGYKEMQHFFAASIPLMLQYHTVGAGPQWYIDGGAKIFLPLTMGIDVSAQQMNLSGYYPDLNLEVSNLPQHGFGTINNWKSSASFSLKPAAALSAGTGVSFPVSTGMRLYTGVYFDLGLTDMKQGSDSMPLVTYSSGGVGAARANSVMNMKGVGEATLFSVGIEVRLSFGARKSVHKARPVDTTAQMTVTVTTKESAASSAAVSVTQSASTPPPAPTPVPVTPAPVPQSTPARQPTAPESKPTPVTPATPATSSLSDDEKEALDTPVIFGVIGGTFIPELEKQHLDQVVSIMKRHPEMRLSLVGHICNSATETEGPKVGLARATAVAKYLIERGINKKRMKVSTMQESDPVVPSDPYPNYQNRRVVMTVE